MSLRQEIFNIIINNEYFHDYEKCDAILELFEKRIDSKIKDTYKYAAAIDILEDLKQELLK